MLGLPSDHGDQRPRRRVPNLARFAFLDAAAHRLYPEWDYTADSTVANRGTRFRALRTTGERETAGAIDSLRHHDLGVPFGT